MFGHLCLYKHRLAEIKICVYLQSRSSYAENLWTIKET